MSAKDAHFIGICSKISNRAMEKAINTERANMLATSVKSLRPKACEVRPLEPILRKPNSQ